MRRELLLRFGSITINRDFSYFIQRTRIGGLIECDKVSENIPTRIRQLSIQASTNVPASTRQMSLQAPDKCPNQHPTNVPTSTREMSNSTCRRTQSFKGKKIKKRGGKITLLHLSRSSSRSSRIASISSSSSSLMSSSITVS